MFLLDRLLVGGIRFVLDKVAQAADAELNDVDALRNALLEAQMRHELGELGAEELADLEAAIMLRLREIEERRRAEAGHPTGGGTLPADARIAGVEISFGGDEHEAEPERPARPEPPEPPEERAPRQPDARASRRKRRP